MSRVLVVEDERGLLRALAMNLTARGHHVIQAGTGAQALAAAAADPSPEVIILDLGLPDISGFDVIRGVRAHSRTPIIVLSARTGSQDKVTALDLGADDYVTKPFSIDELLARLRAAARRANPAEATSITIGTITVDFTAKTACGADGSRVHLTPTEWQLLEVLARQPGRLVPRREILDHLRGGPDHTDPSYLRIYIAQLRRKLEPEANRPRHLITEPGMGYRLQL